MARKPRFIFPGVPQHIVQRGNNRKSCFFSTDDYLHYLQELKKAASRNKVAVHAYVLMTNHVHLLATPEEDYGITHMMQDLGRKYVSYINRTHARTGTLWEGRYKASLVDSDAYLFTCMHYIELNPVRAGMVSNPGDYNWSSYSVNALGKRSNLIRPHPLYHSLGNTTTARTRAYGKSIRGYHGGNQIDEIRFAMNHELVLGGENFKDEVEQKLNRQARPLKPGRPRNS